MSSSVEVGEALGDAGAGDGDSLGGTVSTAEGTDGSGDAAGSAPEEHPPSASTPANTTAHHRYFIVRPPHAPACVLPFNQAR